MSEKKDCTKNSKCYLKICNFIKEIYDFIQNNKWYVLLVVGLLGLYFYQFHGGLSSESEKWDHFGSYIGGIFSAVTLLSVLHGMQLERKRFNDQKIEFENEKKEQEERRRKEDFERTFFMMLEQHNETLRFLENKDYGKPQKIGISNILNKRSIVDNVYYYLIRNINKFRTVRLCLKNDVYYADINAYFINLYRILKFIYKYKEINIDNEYSSLLRSFLSRKMLLILAYHLCERNNDYKQFKLYINEFSFLEHIDFIGLEKDFISNCVFNYIESKDVYNDIEYIFSNVDSKSLDDLILYIKQSKNYNDDAYEFLINIVSRKKGKFTCNSLMKEPHFNCIKDHLFIHIIRNFDKNCFLGNKVAESAYDVYYDLILQEAK
ncbi:putative phage abortive infection protein [Actinobacillus arthritidis]|uniref:putative phage abortive infection protein n=1 Tax=Actinobacillus arthritidis TaxID=157339 RepID=UPI0024435E27|nr:putative phage abortive infection protein [Actinobacillus arthritidis]WGE88796.1 putative phage abortive infection protein [Actinobacillus arthritidis]